MTEQRIIEIAKECRTLEELLEKSAYESGYEYGLTASDRETGAGLEKVFDPAFVRGFHDARRAPKHLFSIIQTAATAANQQRRI